MPLFPRRKRGNRKVVEVLMRIREKREQVVPTTRSALQRVVDESGLPDEVKAFVGPLVDDDRLVGFVFTKFSASLTEEEGEAIADDPQRGQLLEKIIAFIERGGLMMILEFILGIIGAF